MTSLVAVAFRVILGGLFATEVRFELIVRVVPVLAALFVIVDILNL